MNSIRPLITISILIAAGVFLYTKINENPARLVPDGNEASQNGAGDVPPLAAATPSGMPNGPASLTPSPALNNSASSSDGNAPQWPPAEADKTCPVPPISGEPAGAAALAKNGTPGGAGAALTPDLLSLPEVPKIPDLPPLPGAPEAASPATSPPTVTPLSINSATASGAPKVDDTKTASGGGPSLGSPAPINPPTSTAGAKAANDDRYGPMAASAPPAMNATPAIPAAANPSAARAAPTSFAVEWPTIQAALAQQELGKAHHMLSKWYGDSTLSPAEAEQVQSLLNQLAGTVIYSNQSCLDPPYTVRAGDTLESIAKQYDVPWQLLAKINGIPAADLVQPGQQLKVIRGPFAATVDLGKGQMTLQVDGRYAGRFPVTVEPNASAAEGQWSLEQKLSAPSTNSTGAASSVYAVGPAAVDHILVLKKDSSPGGEISITSGPMAPTQPMAAAPPALHLAPRDADEVADILSVGSRVTITK